VGLNLGLIDELDPVLKQLGDGLSEYNFSNLYLFRQTHDYRLIDGDYRFIEGITYDGERHLMPLFELSDAPVSFLRVALQDYDCFYPISQQSLARLDESVFSHNSNPDDSDYLYPGDNFIHYRGATLRKKRNLMHQYHRAGDMQVLPMQEDNVADAIGVLDAWQVGKGKPRNNTDYDACLEALQNNSRLGMEAYVHYCNGQCTGFVMGKNLGAGICSIQFAKGLRTYNGVYPAMFHDFATRKQSCYQYYNFEQDLGIVNFRKNKLSYQPEMLLKKYRVQMIKQTVSSQSASSS